MFAEVVAGILCFIIYVVWYSITDFKERKKRNTPPGVYEVPYFGGALQLVFAAGMRGQHYEKFHRVSQKYGHTVAGRLGEINAALTENYETVKTVLNSPDWVNRFPNLPRFREHMLYKNLGLMWGDSEPHREMRKFTFRTFRAVGFGELKKAEDFLQEELAIFVTNMDERIEKSVGNELFIKHTFKIPAFNMLWRVMSGSRFSYDDEKVKKLIAAVDDVSNINIGLDPEWTFPILRFIPGCSPSRSKRQSFITCHEFFIDIMNERRELGKYKEYQADFIDHFLLKIDEEKHRQPDIYCDEQFHVTCVDLLFGGMDTTSNSLEFALIYMTKFPRVQKKVQEEIDAVVGPNRFPSVNDRSLLRYCEATLLETLRWANIVPMNGRTSACDTTLGPYNVKKDTLCALNTTVIHMSKELWGDPEEFRPERFLDENNNIVNSEKIFAFGGGHRQCPGYTQAKVIWIGFFATTFQHYTFQPSFRHPRVSLIPDHGITNNAKPFYCIVKQRLQK